jgi:DNA repair protein SbcD/Mre11
MSAHAHTSSDRPRLRLLHTSDIHVGSTTHSLVTLDAVVAAAQEESVDGVLIAGDLFDHARLDQDTLDAVVERLGRLSQPTVVIPGNHDCVDATSIYNRVDLREAGDHVHFVGEPEGRELIFEELALAVWARGIQEHHPGHRPLEGFRPADPRYWRVVLTHGHFVPADERSDRSSQIAQHELASLECDYVALGHWHHFVDLSTDEVSVFYSGSPWQSDPENATVNVVTLDPHQGVSVQRTPLAADLLQPRR